MGFEGGSISFGRQRIGFQTRTNAISTEPGQDILDTRKDTEQRD
jgi:hypothetical protein